MTNPSHVDQWVTVAKAARLMGVSRPTVYAMIARGELAAEYVAGRLAVRKDAIHALRRQSKAAA